MRFGGAIRGLWSSPGPAQVTARGAARRLGRATRGVCLALGLVVPGRVAAAPPDGVSKALEPGANTAQLGPSLDRTAAAIRERLADIIPAHTITTELRGARARAMPELVDAYAEGRAFSFRGAPARVRELVALALFGADGGRDPAARGPLFDVDVIILRDDQTARAHVVVPRAADRGRPPRHEWRDGEVTWVPLSDYAVPGVDYTLFKRDGTQTLAHQWAQRAVIEQLVTLARTYQAKTGQRLGIGDLSQLFGGKLRGHWTHRRGVDVDVYLIEDDEPIAWCHAEDDGVVTWTSEPHGKGSREPPPAYAGDDTASRLAVLAELFVENDDIAYLVHDASDVLAPFDAAAHARKPGRHALHLQNRIYWPSHPDHAHLRWHLDDHPLPETPRP
jgi:hypothetical protein